MIAGMEKVSAHYGMEINSELVEQRLPAYNGTNKAEAFGYAVYEAALYLSLTNNFPDEMPDTETIRKFIVGFHHKLEALPNIGFEVIEAPDGSIASVDIIPIN